jgi:hypothetical protein
MEVLGLVLELVELRSLAQTEKILNVNKVEMHEAWHLKNNRNRRLIGYLYS